MSHSKQNLQRLFEHAFASKPHDACWQPSVDVYHAPTAWLVKFDLAGVRPEDIEVVLDGQRLIVRGVRRDWTILEGQQAYSMEISYNRFERVVQLPVNVETSRFASEYRDGMFLVSITSECNNP
jgi:HSP20 family protein